MSGILRALEDVIKRRLEVSRLFFGFALDDDDPIAGLQFLDAIGDSGFTHIQKRGHAALTLEVATVRAIAPVHVRVQAYCAIRQRLIVH